MGNPAPCLSESRICRGGHQPVTSAARTTSNRKSAVSQGQAATTYQPPAALAYGQTYYWRVDEISAAPGTALFKGKDITPQRLGWLHG